MLDILSWNIRKYNTTFHTFLKQFLLSRRPDVLFLCETRRTEEVLKAKLSQHKEYNFLVNVHTPDKWHGVALLVRKDHTFSQVQVEMNIDSRRDTKTEEASTGRLLSVLLNEKLFIVGVYCPAAGSKKKCSYRTEVWDPCLKRVLEKISANGPVICLGDLNVAAETCDYSDKRMLEWSGHSEKERENFRDLLASGFVDTFRLKNGTSREYSWRGKSVTGKYGIRLDYVLVSPSLTDKVEDAFVLDIEGCLSDHLPVGIFLH